MSGRCVGDGSFGTRAWKEGRKGKGKKKKGHTRDDNILRPVQDLHAAVGVPNRQIPRVQRPALEQLARGLGVLEVPLGADVAEEDDLPDLLAVLGHVPQRAGWLLSLPLLPRRLDDPDGQADDEPVALARHAVVPLPRGQGVPRREEVPLGDGPVGLGHAVDVHGAQVQAGHLLEQVARGRGGGDGDVAGLVERGGGRVGAEEGVDRRGGVEVGDALGPEEAPDQGVVDLAEADVRAADGGHGPGEGPPHGVEPVGERETRTSQVRRKSGRN